MMKVAGGKVDKNGAMAHVKSESWKRIVRAVIYFWNEVQAALNKSNPRPYLTPSLPGEPPRKRTGFGAGNVIYELDEKAMAGRVGVLKNAWYMAVLELYRNRPWLMGTFKKVQSQLESMMK